MFINNNQVYEIYMDTLYPGCTIGSYSCLVQGDYTITGRAKTECLIIRLSIQTLGELRRKFEIVDLLMLEYEEYIRDNGLPYLDYKLHRSKTLTMSPLK